jgi:flagellar hook-associated protein 3 FlgL
MAMRISTAQIYDRGVDGIERQQSALSLNQQRIASGRRILTPSDDPVGAAQSVTLTQAKDRMAQYGANIDAAKDALAQNDSVLSQVEDVLQSVRTLAVQGATATLTDSDRKSIAQDVQSRLQELVTLANSRDGDGRYLFAGFATGTQPFALNASGTVTYSGDQGRRTLDVAPGRTMAVAFDGSSVFEQVRGGNGSFTTQPASGNAGTGVISTGSVVDPSQLPGDTYRLQFAVSGGTTTYDVIDVTSGATVSSGNAYTAGSAITVAGMQVSVSGAPGDGDSFTLAPSGAQSLFSTLQGLAAVLAAPASGNAAAGAALQNGTSQALASLDQALDHVLTLRATAGASLRELDDLANGNADRSTQYDQTLSRLNDLDYNQALSDFAKQQLALQAAQQSFAKVSTLSLFNYLTP